MLLYYITDRKQFPGTEAERRTALLQRIRLAAEAGVDFVQLRERDLPAGELESLARDAVACVSGSKTKLLINHRADVAIAAGAAGVHLRSRDELTTREARSVFQSAGVADPVIAVSCHSRDEVLAAEQGGANFVVFGPVFMKNENPGTGLEVLRSACRGVKVPVLALGGVSRENARACVSAGAAGVAGIRIFQTGDIPDTMRRLRAGAA